MGLDELIGKPRQGGLQPTAEDRGGRALAGPAARRGLVRGR